MKCPLCGREMRLGQLETWRGAPAWKSADGKEKFTFGLAKLLVNRTPNVWHCPACDAMLIEKSVGKFNPCEEFTRDTYQTK